MIRKSLQYSFLPFLFMAGAQFAPAQPSIQGAVKDTLGTPVPGAIIVFHRIAQLKPPQRPGASPSDLAPGEQRFSALATSDSTGRFIVQNLPSGPYYSCVSIDHPQLLHPCDWSSMVRTEITAGAPAPGLQFTLQRGRRLGVQMSDPLQLLPPLKGATRPQPVIVGVQTLTGSIHVARTVSDAGKTRTWEITIPSDSALRLWLFTTELQITDSNGKALDTSGPRSGIQIAPGNSDEKIALTVTRRAGQ